MRRLKNTSRTVGEVRRRKMLTRMMVKLKRSGYDEKFRRSVLVAGIRGYNSMVRIEEEGGRRVNRPRWEGAKERRYKKLAAKTSWFRKRRRVGM